MESGAYNAFIERVGESFRAGDIKSHALSLHQQVLQSFKVGFRWRGMTSISISRVQQ